MNSPKPMKRYLLVSRFAPSERQIRLAKEKGIELIPGTDYDAFGPTLPSATINIRGRDIELDGFIVVHPLLALRLLAHAKDIGVFENEQQHHRPGERPVYIAKALHIFNMTQGGGELMFHWNGTEVGALQTG